MDVDWQAVVLDFNSSLLTEPGGRCDRVMNALTEDLGLTYTPSDEPDWAREEWAERVVTAGSPDTDVLLARLDHADLEIRRMTAFVLCYATQDGRLPAALRARVGTEPDPATRIALLVALGRFPGHRPFLTGCTAPGFPAAVRFGAAFSLAMALPGPRYKQTGEIADETGADLSDDLVDALTLFLDPEVAAALSLLPWTDPEWDDLPSSVGASLWQVPHAASRWIARLLALVKAGECDAGWAHTFCSMASERIHRHNPRLGRRLGPVLGDLLTHAHPDVREAALRHIGRWLRDAEDPESTRYADLVAATLEDPRLTPLALEALVDGGDERCVPGVLRLLTRPVDAETSALLPRVGRFAETLMPAVRARLADPADLAEIGAILDGILPWPSGPKACALPEFTALLTGFGGERPNNVRRSVTGKVCEAVGHLGPRAAGPETVAALRALAAGAPLTWRLAPIDALTRLGHPVEETTALLTAVLGDLPLAAGGPDGFTHAGGTWAGTQACRRLGGLGPAAHKAEPVLRALLDDGRAAPIRDEVAWALWLIAGDARATVPALLEGVGEEASTRNRCQTAIRRLREMGAAAEAALPVLDALAGDRYEVNRWAKSAAHHIRRSLDGG
ncbi:hypothetical protein [Rhizohabitans arisaemae]|uniref:hypothetical protein n=1 Tax=Rhizohabitans arisaemae TaxID=2720610 RepID=UPI0024B103E7|nr:hypothetical protein [Rhizohabitans arisaemae]